MNKSQDIVREASKAVLKISEDLVDQVLFGDIEQAPLSLIRDKVDPSRVRAGQSRRQLVAYIRMCVAATIRQRFGGPHATRR